MLKSRPSLLTTSIAEQLRCKAPGLQWKSPWNFTDVYATFQSSKKIYYYTSERPPPKSLEMASKIVYPMVRAAGSSFGTTIFLIENVLLTFKTTANPAGQYVICKEILAGPSSSTLSVRLVKHVACATLVYTGALLLADWRSVELGKCFFLRCVKEKEMFYIFVQIWLCRKTELYMKKSWVFSDVLKVPLAGC